MTNRDRLVIVSIVALAVLGGVWLMLVSPERKKATQLRSQVSTAREQLASAQGQASGAHAAQVRYSAAYASVVSLGKAVPVEEEVPSLMYQLAQASNQKHVQFSSIATGAGVGAPSSSSSPSAPAGSAASASATTGFTQMPFTFVFEGSFADLYHMFNEMNGFTLRTAKGGLRVSGRLLTIQGVKLTPESTGRTPGSSSNTLVGTVTATAYVLPASQGLTGGATASSPTSGSTSPASGAPSSTAASSASSQSSNTPAAVTGVTR